MIDFRGRSRLRLRAIVPGVGLALVIAGQAACGAPAQPSSSGPTPTPLGGSSSAAGAATASGAGPSSPGSPLGTPGPASGMVVAGTVVAAPGCAGPALAEPCPDRPVAGARVELTRGGAVVATTKTDAAGRFQLRVPPGAYQLTAFNVGFASRASQSISVSGPVTIRLVVDSGIR